MKPKNPVAKNMAKFKRAVRHMDKRRVEEQKMIDRLRKAVSSATEKDRPEECTYPSPDCK